MSSVLVILTLTVLPFFPHLPPEVCFLRCTNVSGTCRASGMQLIQDNQLEGQCFPSSLGSPEEPRCTLHQPAWAEGYSLQGICNQCTMH